VRYEPSWRDDPRLHPFVGEKRAKLAVGKVLNDDRCDWTAAWRLFPGDVWHSALHGSEVEASLAAAGFQARSQIIWDKGRLIISRGHYHWRHEPCWYAVRKGRTAGWTGDRKQTTVWLIPHRRSETGHAAQKPLLCMQRPIENHTRPGDAVYDPFVGSGTTIIAAEQLGRVAIAIELNPAYCDIAIARWQTLTRRRACLVG
jgi:DNA modification methylase